MTVILCASRPRQMGPAWGLARPAIVECAELLPITRIYVGESKLNGEPDFAEMRRKSNDLDADLRILARAPYTLLDLMRYIPS